MTGCSIVIPHYGDPVPTFALVRQLLPQLAGIHELIVVDDSSAEPFPSAPGATVVRREVNGGFGAAVNSGAAAANGDLLLILNSDLEVSPTFLNDLLASASPWQPCVAGPRIVDPDGQVDPTARRFPTVSHQVVEWLTPLARWRHHELLHEAVGHNMDAVTGDSAAVTDWLVGAALLLPTALFREVGGFDERFHMNSEEVDLQRRLRERGIPSIYLPNVTVTHEGGGSSDPAQRRAWLVESRRRYAEKWGGSAALRAGLTVATTANLLWNLGRRALGRDTRPLATARYEFDLIRGKQR